MSANPYEPSAEVPTEAEDVRRARRWVIAPAWGIGISGAVYFAFGMFFIGASVVLGGRIVNRVMEAGNFGSMWPDAVIALAGFCAIGLVCVVVGWLAMRYSWQLFALTSDRGAHVACILGLIMYPLCVLTLPLGIYGLIVLRRTDVQAVLKRCALPKDGMK